MIRYNYFFIVLAFLFMVEGLCFFAFGANVNINLVMVNPSEKKTKDTPIKYYLPQELRAEDIMNTNGLELDYDIDQGAYYVHGKADLDPKESKTIKIEVKDVWHIDPEEVTILKDQIENNVAMLEGKDYYDAAVLLKETMVRKLDYILAQQNSYSDNIERRIEEYRAHADTLREMRDDAFTLDYFRNPQSPVEQNDKIKFFIEVKNSSETEAKKVQQQHYLPKEVTAEDVLERQGFEVRFDHEKKQSFLAKEEEFKPGETKRYEIVIKDIWRISLEQTETMREKTEKAAEELKASEYSGNASYLAEGIVHNLDEIEKNQKDKQDMKKYIGAARANKARFKDAEKDFDKLSKLLAFVKSKKLEELEKSKVKNVLQKIQALRGVAALSSAIFGKRPTLTFTWKVIWGTMGFVAFFTVFHFFTWWQRSKLMGEGLAVKTGGVIKPATSVEAGTEEAQEKKK